MEVPSNFSKKNVVVSTQLKIIPTRSQHYRLFYITVAFEVLSVQSPKTICSITQINLQSSGRKQKGNNNNDAIS